MRHPLLSPHLVGAVAFVLFPGLLTGSAHGAEAAALFAQHCSACHGAEGAGDGPVGPTLTPPAADLTASTFQSARSDDQLAAAIAEGGVAVGKSPLMPAFGAQLGPDEVTALVEWIRARQAPSSGAEAPAARGASPPPAARRPLPTSNPFSRTRFHLAGFATLHFEYTEETGPTFSSVQLAPVFLWRLHDRFLFEAEMEMGYADGGFNIGVEYTQLDIVVWDYITIVAGLSLNPLGIFGERLHPGWINRMMDAPYPYQGGHGAGPLPMAGLGVQVRGAIPLAQVSSLNYAVFFSNGPSESDGAITLGGGVPDNNWDKNVGGRIGVLPVRELELGVSATTGLWNDEFDQRYSALVGDVIFARWGLNVQGEYIATWTQEEAEAEALVRQYWWAQLAYRLEPAPGILNRFEFVFRYGGASLPAVEHDETDAEAMLAAALEAAQPSVFFSVGHAATPSDDHGEESNAALPEGLSNQVGGGVNFYPIPAVAVRLGAHYTIETQHFHLGLSLATGF